MLSTTNFAKPYTLKIETRMENSTVGMLGMGFPQNNFKTIPYFPQIPQVRHNLRNQRKGEGELSGQFCFLGSRTFYITAGLLDVEGSAAKPGLHNFEPGWFCQGCNPLGRVDERMTRHLKRVPKGTKPAVTL